MGTLKYDGTSVDFPDHVLAHLEVVTIQKLRRQESFFMSWLEPESAGGGRTGIWVHPAAVLTFHYAANEPAKIDRGWVERLTFSASSAAGMMVSDAEGHPTPSSDPTRIY
jgi:hypothetical protein